IIGIILFVIIAGLVFFGNYLLEYSLSRKNNIKEPIESRVAQVWADGYDMDKDDAETSDWWWNKHEMEVLKTKSFDGLNLVGYYIPANVETEKLIVFIHGYTTSAEWASKFARYYHRAGYNFFAADCRGHGRSEGGWITMGQLDYKDYLQWLELLINKFGKNVRIVLTGISMGGATVSLLSSQEDLPKQVKCVVEDCGFTSVAEEFSSQIKVLKLPCFPFIPLANLVSEIRLGISFYKPSPIDNVSKSKVPILFIHGSNDEFVPTTMGQQLYEAANCEKELWLCESAVHANSIDIDPDGYLNTVINFIEKYLE
ncbi:MAG: alpha/beta hydrolase fold, partial [Clostridia bacterium]|nr:alpha/beta hydrolase fold [Clostridia bacterium]